MSDIVPNLSFEQKMLKRIQDSIGDLMSDDDLKKIMERGIDAALFQRRRVQRDYGRYDDLPSLVEEATHRFLNDRLTVLIRAWMEDNKGAMEKIVQQTLAAGMGELVLQSLDQRFANAMPFILQQLKSQNLLP
jgi:hypothetical protein